MPEELFLILHKVRGQPAFDIAQRLTIGDEEGWIIPTSGHRAYPCWHFSIKTMQGMPWWECPCDVPATLPDHYSTNATPRPSLREVLNIFRPTALKKRTL